MLSSDPKISFLTVRDPNQCIFKFAGANDNTFEKLETFFSLERKEKPFHVTLRVNYRSDKAIVDYGNETRVIQAIEPSIPFKLTKFKKVFRTKYEKNEEVRMLVSLIQISFFEDERILYDLILFIFKEEKNQIEHS